MKYLITGASGYLGSHLMRVCSAQTLDAFGTQSRPRHENLVTWDLGRDSLVDKMGRTFFESGPVTVIHCAFIRGMEACASEPEECRRINVERTAAEMRALDGVCEKQVYISSGYVFDGQRGGYGETDQPSPQSEYGRQKLAMESFLRASIPEALIIRIDKLIGDRPDEEHLLTEWLRTANSGQAIRCLNDQLFSATLVDDVAKAIVLACQRRLSGIYHVAAPEPITRTRLAELFVSAISPNTAVVEVTEQDLGLLDPRPRNSSLNVTKFMAAAPASFTTYPEIVARFAARLGE